MKKLTEKVELTANILIIGVVLLGGSSSTEVPACRSPAPSQPTARVQPVIGSKVNLPDENWSNQQKTLILALNKGCRFCNESAAFYKRHS